MKGLIPFCLTCKDFHGIEVECRALEMAVITGDENEN